MSALKWMRRDGDQGEELLTVGKTGCKFDERQLLRAALCLMAATALCSTICAQGTPAKATDAKPVASAKKKAPPSPWTTPSMSTFDLSAGYAYWKPSGSLSNGNAFEAIKAGAMFSGAYYFSRHFGVDADVGIHPETSNDGAATFAGGIIYRIPTAHFTPFFHALGGAAHLTGANIPTIGTSSYFYNHAGYGALAMGGGGLDYEPSWKRHLLGIRLFEVDYENIQKDFGAYTATSGGDAKLNVVRLGAGLVVHFGDKTPEPRVEYSCEATPGIVFPGDPVRVIGTVGSAEPNKKMTFSWSTFGGRLTSKDNSTTVDTTGLAPGTYEVRGIVRQGPKANENAVCSASFIVRQYPGPTISCSADPEMVAVGQVVAIHAEAKEESPYKLTFSYKTTAGTLAATGDTATLQTSGVDVGIVRVTCTVTDEAGQSASAMAVAAIEPTPTPPQPKTQRLCSLNFTRDPKRPTRVDNEAKACLDDIALTLEHYSAAKIIIVGQSAACEKKGEAAAVQRAANAGDYLIHQKGIDAARVEYRLGQAGVMQVDNYLLPPGANFNQDVPGTLLVEESQIKPEPRVALPMRHTKRPGGKSQDRK